MKTTDLTGIRGDRLQLIHLYGGELIALPGDVHGPRTLKDCELLYIIDGSAEYCVGKNVWEVPAGGLVLGRPGLAERYIWSRKQPNRHAYFHFHIETYPSDWPDPEEWPRVWADPSPLARDLFKQIVGSIYSNYNWPAESPGRSDCVVLEMLMDLFLYSSEQAGEQRNEKRPEPVERALELMSRTLQTNPGHNLSLNELSAAASVTEKHLCRLFTSTIGHPPVKTYSLLKLIGSRQLLERTNLSIKEVAERCGFGDQFQYARNFSKVFGVSPSAYRLDPANESSSASGLLPLDLIPRTYW